ncbi:MULTISPECIES: GntR family transcriptional regulator [Pseudomonas]|uniref:GntR family transcriptional regulator n=1 Tax=Pseudomonas TaxID=286 RepID=UPI00021731B8|nr:MULTISPECIES: GntR family transcriptional regulator [Pseudomonas]AEJ12886.1 GntR family transcriptional regulator [Pseudomonas putida S16]ELF6208277.1 GntR family transcriptional regulator [Pseudomonas putida]WOB61155.1 GntR family transcriptional regulator [Pseudomonas sp. NBB]
MQYLDSISNISNIDKKKIFEIALNRRILDMSMAPGSAIDEIALCKEFGLSRPPVREALRHAAGEGYIEMTANRAPRVSPITEECFKRFAQAARMLYVAIAHLAAKAATERNICNLHALHKQLSAAGQAANHQACVLLECALLFEIGKISGNHYLAPSLKRLLVDHARIQNLIYRSQSVISAARDALWFISHYALLISAVELRDTGRASRTSDEISQRILERVEAYSTTAQTTGEDAI